MGSGRCSIDVRGEHEVEAVVGEGQLVPGRDDVDGLAQPHCSRSASLYTVSMPA